MGVPVPEDLVRAVELMRKRGWHQGAAVGPGGSICAARALTLAARERGERGTDFVVVSRWLGLTSHYVNPIVLWNDANSRTFDEVQRLFLATAVRIRRDWDSEDELPGQ